MCALLIQRLKKTTLFHIFILVILSFIKAPFNPLTGYDKNAEYRIMNHLIYRLTKDRYQALILILTMQRFPALGE